MTNEWAKTYNVTESIKRVRKATWAYETAALFAQDLKRHSAMDESEFVGNRNKKDQLEQDQFLENVWRKEAERRAAP